MMKKNVFSLIVFLSIATLSFSQTAEYGFAYDTFSTKTFGLFGNISNPLTKQVSLTARLDYFGGNNYKALVATEYKPVSFGKLYGGFTIYLEETYFFPGVDLNLNLWTKKLFDLNLNFILGLNPNNVLKPGRFQTNVSLVTKEATSSLELIFGYTSNLIDSSKRYDINIRAKAFQENVPFVLGLKLDTQTLLGKNNFTLLIDTGISGEIHKESEIITISFVYRVFGAKKTSHPFLISFSKKVTI